MVGTRGRHVRSWQQQTGSSRLRHANANRKSQASYYEGQYDQPCGMRIHSHVTTLMLYDYCLPKIHTVPLMYCLSVGKLCLSGNIIAVYRHVVGNESRIKPCSPWIRVTVG